MKAERADPVVSVDRADNALASSLFALVKDSLTYVIGAAMLGAGNFVLVPVYARYLDPAAFGVFALVDSAILVIVSATQLGLTVSYLKWFAETEGSHVGELLGSVLGTAFLAAVIGGAVLALFSASDRGRAMLPGVYRFWWSLLPIVVLENLQGMLLSDLRARRCSVAYSAAMVVRLLAVVAASVWFVVISAQGLAGVFWGRLVGDSVGALLLGIRSLRAVRLTFSWSRVVPMVRYGMPLVCGALVGLLLDASGRYFLSHYGTLEQVGYFGMAIKVSGVFQTLVVQPFGIAWGGLMFQIAQRRHARLVFSKALNYVFVLSLAAALVLSIFSKSLFAILASSAYLPAMEVFPVVVLVRAVNMMMYVTGIGVYLSGRTRWFVPIYLLGLVVNGLLNCFLVPAFGMFGAAWTWLIAWGAIVALMALVGQRYYSLQFSWPMIALPAAAWMALLVVSVNGSLWRLYQAPWTARILLTLVVVTVVVLLLLRDLQTTRMRIRQRSAAFQ